jgi:site-specific recombinase XerD
MNDTINVLFFAKKSKTTTEGLVPIYLRVTINGSRFEISTKRYVLEQQWSTEAGKMKGNSDEVKSVNSLLESMRARAFERQKQLLLEGKEVTIESFRQKWLGSLTEKPRMLLEIFDHHNQQMKTLVGKEYAPFTMMRYVTARKHTASFIQWKFKATDIDIRNIKFEFITDFEFWLKSVRNCEHNSTIKYLTNFKKVINICLKNGWLTRNPFFGFKMTKREIERPYLSQEEIDTIASKEILIDRIAQVRDIFLFSCYTGLAYVDVQKLNRNEIATGIDGEKWIFTHRQKTETATRIPLLPPAREILDRYVNHPQCLNQGRLLPVLSNQKMNAYLKEIADVCGITKKMTFHTARHTFATTVTLTNGVPIETVSKMLGHKNLKTTQHYAKIIDMKVSEDMKGLREKFIIKPLVSIKSESR